MKKVWTLPIIYLVTNRLRTYLIYYFIFLSYQALFERHMFPDIDQIYVHFYDAEEKSFYHLCFGMISVSSFVFPSLCTYILFVFHNFENNLTDQKCLINIFILLGNLV